MVEMGHQPIGRPSLWWLLIAIGVIAAVVLWMYVMTMKRMSGNVAGATREADPVQQEARQPRDPDITMNRVAENVFHLDFGGELCDTVRCLERATALVLEQNHGYRIISIAPNGAYGSPTSLVIVLAPNPAP